MTEYLKRSGQNDLAYNYTKASDQKGADIIFLPGFRSDMEGNKALHLEKFCRDNDLGCLRFDYSGHGLSEGAFEDGCITQWLEDTLDILDKCSQSQEVYLVGSSMGGWLALLTALARPDKIAGIIGIAAAPDFTRDVLANANPEQCADLEDKAFFEEISPYSATPLRFTKKLLDDGENHCLLDKPIHISCPVILHQGMRDTDVPWQKAVCTVQLLESKNKVLRLVEGADHRFSNSMELDILTSSVAQMTNLKNPHEGSVPLEASFVSCEILLES